MFFNRRRAGKLPEVDEYYDGTQKESSLKTWLMAFLSVLLVSFVILSVFLTGRWAYREITNNKNTDKSAGSSVATNENSSSKDLPSFDGGPKEANNTEEDNAKDTKSKGDETKENRGDEELKPEDRSVDAPAYTDTPNTDQSIPNTGPEHTLAVFIAISTLAGLGHSRYLRQRSIS